MTNQSSQVVDFEQRQSALDISCSIAVQAPAGSGKTELLSLRFLKLLALCKHPEEVLAITFTKKAANEMAERILSTLDWAQIVDADSITTQLDEDRYRIAHAVLKQDRQESWNLQQSPNRLRIQTIDSFCNFLASRLPILSNFGGPLQISEQVDDCYQIAIRNCLRLMDSEQPIAPAIAELMLHFDNDNIKLETLLTNLLKQREQWIGDIVGVASSPEQALHYLTGNLIELAEESMENAAQLLRAHATELVPLLEYATKNLAETESNSDLLHCAGLRELPACDPVALEQWYGIVDLLLTKNRDKPAFRKAVDKKIGFPAPSGNKEQKELLTEKKQAMKSLLQSLSESEELLLALDYLRRLPVPEEDTLSWDFLNVLTAILPTLMAELELAFGQRNKVDYPQVSLAALRALGSEDAPTDLALSLDYQIKHILVDEFQDTSSSQMDLLRMLTVGWEQEDGRTLFVVGDAMQSCYGFRNANVGLFIKLRESGLGNISLKNANLEANFRSDAGVVDWVNSVFVDAFPLQDDVSRGAVSYSHSHAVHSAGIEPAVSTRIFQFAEEAKLEAYIQEGAYMAEEISRLRKQHPDREIAILVRGRAHLEYILPALREADIPWLATDIDRLAALPLITDLISLTSAVCNEVDRLSWLSVLRAPWCGISLEDLHQIANWNGNISVLQSLSEITELGASTALSADGYARISKIEKILQHSVAAKIDTPIERIIRSTFNDLGGQQLIGSSSELDSLEKFFELLKDSESAGSMENFSEFQSKVANSFTSSEASNANNPVQIMTIHKSKGLEFDHVFLPGLARTSRADDKSLLLWHQRLNSAGRNKLFLATLSATGSEDNSLYNLLRYEKAEKSRLETTRLLYIAVTRAAKSVYLSAALADKDDEPAAPASRSLLATIWDVLQDQPALSQAIEISKVQAIGLPVMNANPRQTCPSLRRLPSSAFGGVERRDQPSDAEDEPAKDEHRELAVTNQLQIETGNLVHEALQNSLRDRTILESPRLENLRVYWERHLQQFSFSREEIDSALTKVEKSLLQTLQNEELSWVFDNDQRESAAELAMQSHAKGYVHTHIVDRTFIDKDGERWIIDYKSSEPARQQSLESFLEEQATLYTPQLSRYKELFASEDHQGIRTALLFTSLPLLHECKA